ncbi:hypothetical protein FF100_33585 [Methylobacterium terricola]|uniref:Uncharacterized protein n=1 Tax=Methylobacterium terricola TaxID=2583531 RepID=A0A5C4L698_9HYPH|nr:hypothetical protein [Methylobacterium terricola]TNC07106.1 hypothetical protein FF100_33585 [Methylobacterium terricola]
MTASPECDPSVRPHPRDAVREAEARRLALRDRFEALFAEWLRNRASAIGDFDGADIPASHTERETELARLIATTPAPSPWMVFRKLEVLAHYLGDEGVRWADRREVVMLAGIRADLLRLGVGEAGR